MNAARRAWQALKREQLAALVGAADPKNPALVLIAAFCAKNAQNGNRAAQEWLLDWSELNEHKNEHGRGCVRVSTRTALCTTCQRIARAG